MQWQPRKLLSVLLISIGTCSMTMAKAVTYEMMLIGSELELCRSSATQFCSGTQAATLIKNSRTAAQYKLAVDQIEKMMSVDLWQPSRQALRYDLHLLFNGIAQKAGTKVLSYSQLLQLWKSIAIKRDGKSLSGHSLFLSMTEAEFAMILDHLEFSQVDYAGRRLKERVQLNEALSSPTMEFAKKIVELASNKKYKPKILIATVGNRDSFSDVDVYIDLFNQIGASASWLPIDAALHQLMLDKKSCNQIERYRANILKSYDRARVYNDLVNAQKEFCNEPAKFNNAIKEASAIILVGSHPQYLNKSFMDNNQDSELLTLIRHQIKNKKLTVVAVGNMAKGLVSKSSKGAVILGGNSTHALFNGTSTYQQVMRACKSYGSCDIDYNSVIYQQGGIGLLNFPIIDTEVSSRGNIARLAQVALESELKRSLSIDRNTAILVNTSKLGDSYTVIGRQGVMYLEDVDKEHSLFNIQYHYFTPDDQLTLINEKISVVYPKWKENATNPEAQLAHYNNLFYGDSFKKFAEQACVIDDQKWSGVAGRNKEFLIELSKNKNSELHMGGLKVGESYQFYCSISSLLLVLKHN